MFELGTGWVGENTTQKGPNGQGAARAQEEAEIGPAGDLFEVSSMMAKSELCSLLGASVTPSPAAKLRPKSTCRPEPRRTCRCPTCSAR